MESAKKNGGDATVSKLQLLLSLVERLDALQEQVTEMRRAYTYMLERPEFWRAMCVSDVIPVGRRFFRRSRFRQCSC